jgi:hypothetical protein
MRTTVLSTLLLLSFFQEARGSSAVSGERLGRSSKVLSSKGRPLQLPLSFTGPVAVLDAGFRADRRIREFAAPDLDGLEQFAPQILVIRLDAALQLADQKLRGLLTLASVDFALIVLTRTEDTPLAQHHRDLLWEAFGVPVFEQLQDAEGRVIARECEVHDGLHLEAGCSAPAGLDCEMLREQCECGAETPRLKPKMVRERAAAAAA